MRERVVFREWAMLRWPACSNDHRFKIGPRVQAVNRGVKKVFVPDWGNARVSIRAVKN